MVNGTSTESRVVPGISLTIVRWSLRMALMSDDLPTFGRPTIAMRVGGAVSGSTPAEKSSVAASSNSGNTEAMAAAMENVLSNPNSENSASVRARPVVIHFIDREKDLLAAGAQFAGNFLVQRHDAFGHVDHHNDGRGHFDGDFGLMPRRVRHQVAAFLVVHERDAARVDDFEGFIAPARRG